MLRRALQLHHDFGGRLGQTLARTQIPADALPAPRVDEQAQGAVSFHVGLPADAWFTSIAEILAPYQGVWLKRAHRAEHVGHFAVYGAKARTGGLFDRQQRDDLEQMVLDHVTQATGGLVE